LNNAGQPRWFRNQTSLVRDETGRPQYAHGLLIDITQSKQAAIELARERNLLRTLIDNVPDFIYAKDRDSRFTLTNQASASTLGQSPQAIVGKTDFELHPAELAQQFLSDEQAVMQSGQPLIDKEEMMYENGQERWQLTTTVPLRDDTGQVVGIVGISRNITARRQAELALKQRLSQLDALRAIDQAISASLDLRLTLAVFLDQVSAQLKVDAADVLLLDPNDQTLSYAAGRGFRSQAFEHARTRLGQGRAGRAALERQMVKADLRAERAATRTGLLSADNFIS
jgi:PAS domain S-box-containing protein